MNAQTTITLARDAIVEKTGRFSLDAAITTGFGRKCEVVKEGLVGEPWGTVQINGVWYDWFQKHNSYRFIPA